MILCHNFSCCSHLWTRRCCYMFSGFGAQTVGFKIPTEINTKCMWKINCRTAGWVTSLLVTNKAKVKSCQRIPEHSNKHLYMPKAVSDLMNECGLVFLSWQHILIVQRQLSVLEEELEEFRLALRQYMDCACAQTGCLQSVHILFNHISHLFQGLYWSLNLSEPFFESQIICTLIICTFLGFM